MLVMCLPREETLGAKPSRGGCSRLTKMAEKEPLKERQKKVVREWPKSDLTQI